MELIASAKDMPMSILDDKDVSSKENQYIGKKDDIINYMDRINKKLDYLDESCEKYGISGSNIEFELGIGKKIKNIDIKFEENEESCLLVQKILDDLRLNAVDKETDMKFDIFKYVSNYSCDLDKLDELDYKILEDATDFHQPFFQLIYDFHNIDYKQDIINIFAEVVSKLRRLMELGYIKMVNVIYLAKGIRREPIEILELKKEESLKMLDNPFIWDTSMEISNCTYAYKTTQLGKRVLNEVCI